MLLMVKGFPLFVLSPSSFNAEGNKRRSIPKQDPVTPMNQAGHPKTLGPIVRSNAAAAKGRTASQYTNEPRRFKSLAAMINTAAVNYRVTVHGQIGA
jgi:hypothetical protein